MTTPSRICVFYSKGRNYRDVLRAVKQSLPDAHVCAVIPPCYPVTEEEARLADELVRTESEGYSWRDVTGLRRLIGQLRSLRCDAFAITFNSPKLRVVATLTRASHCYFCRMDGKLIAIHPSVAGTVWDVVSRNVRGRVAYAVIWLIVRLFPVREAKGLHEGAKPTP